MLNNTNGNRSHPLSDKLYIETDKAQIKWLDAGVVEKRYLTNNAMVRAAQDQRSLSFLHVHYKEVLLDGWRYYSPRFIRLNSNKTSYQMEHVTGTPIAKLPRGDLHDAEYRSGIWLATYHNQIIGQGEYGLVFSDYNVHNILVDKNARQIAAIDPGTAWGKTSFAQEDVVHHIHSLLTVLIFKGKAPLTAVFSFLKGYLETRSGLVTVRAYASGFLGDYQRKHRRFRKKRLVDAFTFYLSLLFLLPFNLILVSVYITLWQTMHRGHNRDETG